MVRPLAALSEMDLKVGQQLRQLIKTPPDRLRVKELLDVEDAELEAYTAGTQRLPARHILVLMQAFVLPASYFYSPSRL